MSSACSDACGWCGKCTGAWAGPSDDLREPDTIALTCTSCGGLYEILPDEDTDVRICAGCHALRTLTLTRARQTIGLVCPQCGAVYELSSEPSVPHDGRCHGCLALDVLYTDLKGTKGAA